MLKLQETTIWDCNQKNHIYWTNKSKDKLLAYQVAGSDKITFDTPLKFNTRKRTFKIIK